MIELFISTIGLLIMAFVVFTWVYSIVVFFDNAPTLRDRILGGIGLFFIFLLLII